MGETRKRYRLVPLLTVLALGRAASTAAEAGMPKEEVVLEDSRIDARTVQAGARVLVVHGRGERHPVSGEWAHLDTSAGYVEAVDDSALALAREGRLRQQRIPLDRIHRLVIEVPPGASEEDRGARVFRKLGGGVLGGVVWGFGGMVAGAALGSTENCEGDLCGLGRAAGALLLGTAGYTVGAAIGVSRVDPHDQFIPALGGSAAGLIAGFYMTSAATILWPTLFAAPIITATMMSEWSRDPPEDQRLSIRLRPHPGGGMSAAATLAF